VLVAFAHLYGLYIFTGMLTKEYLALILSKFFFATMMLIYRVDSTTKCNFEQLGKEAKDILVSKASRPASQSSHDLSTP